MCTQHFLQNGDVPVIFSYFFDGGLALPTPEATEDMQRAVVFWSPVVQNYEI